MRFFAILYVMKPRMLLQTAYWAGFLFSMHNALTSYMNSSFLETKINEGLLGFLYTASAVVSLVGLYAVPRLINRFGSSRVLGTLMFANMANLIVLITCGNIWAISACFVLLLSFTTMIYLGLDIMIEHWSSSAVQGSVRGRYLTMLNIGFMLSPLLAGFIADRLGFGVLYGFSLVILVPTLIIAVFRLPSVSISHPSKANVIQLAGKFIRHPELGAVFGVNFMLQFFYSWMVIYGPIYLHETIGIPWDTLGILFTVMLSAFVVFEYPVGKISDKIHGEKFFMGLGLAVMGIATILLVHAPHMTLAALAIVLFATRVGASLVEVSTESYFFKRVSHDDTGTIGFFRNTYPFAYILAPVIASGILLVAPTQTLFIILGCLCLGSVVLVGKIKITKNRP